MGNKRTVETDLEVDPPLGLRPGHDARGSVCSIGFPQIGRLGDEYQLPLMSQELYKYKYY